MQKFYVYELWDTIKKEPFYVGKYHPSYKRYLEHLKEATGIKKFKNSHKLNRIKKIINQGYELEIKIVFETDNESEAFEKEIELIKFYGRRDKKTGSLTNMTDGGEGCSGKIFTEKQRKNISLRVRGSGNPMYGKKHSSEAIKIMSEARRKRKPYRHTEEWKQYLRENSPGGKATSKPIFQIDFNGNIIKKWLSASIAFKKLGYPSRTNIASCAKYKYRTYKSFYWLYEKDVKIINNKIINIDELNRLRLKPHSTIRINQFTCEGAFIKTWGSQLQIKRELKLSNSSNSIISNIIRGKRKSNIYGGFQWAKYQ